MIRWIYIIIIFLLLDIDITSQDIIGIEMTINELPKGRMEDFYSIIPDSVGKIDINIPATNLKPGWHTLFCRSLDDEGRWSIPMKLPFRIIDYEKQDLVQIISAEYFIGDITPEHGSANPLNISGYNDIEADIDLTGMDTGSYTLTVRLKNEFERWSFDSKTDFSICETYGPTANFDYVKMNNLVEFIDSSTVADSVWWDFGDGTGSPDRNPVHIYNEPGEYEVCQYVFNNCGSSYKCMTISIEGLEKVMPDEGGQGGLVTIVITGKGFTKDTEFILRKSDDTTKTIQVDTTKYISHTTFRACLKLYDAEIGMYNLESYTGGSVVILEDAFEVKALIPPELTFEFIGSKSFRARKEANLTLVITNHGNVDALLVPVGFIDVPWDQNISDSLNISITPDFHALAMDDIPVLKEAKDSLDKYAIDPYEYKTYTTHDTAQGTQGVHIIVPRIRTGENHLKFKIHMSQDIGKAGEIKAYMRRPMISNNQDFSWKDDCYATALKCALELAVDFVMGDLKDCVKNVIGSVNDGVSAKTGIGLTDALSIGVTGGHVKSSKLGEATNYVSLASNTSGMIVHCTKALLKTMPAGKLVKIVEIVADIASKAGTGMKYYDCAQNVIDACNVADYLYQFKPIQILTDFVDWITSHDPNMKYGPGLQNDYFIKSNSAFNYTISFENVDTAEAAAQTVKIIDTLDTGVYDLSTFRFINYGWDTVYMPVIEEDTHFVHIIDLRPDHDNFLKIKGDFDKSTGICTWYFETLDTNTLMLTEDVYAGFLPPNINSPEGEGFVGFGIKLKEGIVSGKEIKNKATIIFDVNKPIETNQWLNITDDIAPVSQVKELPVLTLSNEFSVAWEGTDNISGIRYFNIYVSDDDGEYWLWKEKISDTSALFSGEYDHTYKYYSIAVDSAGNVEDTAAVFDTYTTCEEPSKINTTVDCREWVKQNYPNPVKDITYIDFGLSSSCNVRFEFYNMLGEKIFTSNTQKYTGGKHTVEFNLYNYPAGTYIYKMITDNYIFSMPFIKIEK